MKSLKALLPCLISLLGGPVFCFAQQEPPSDVPVANPARPTVSTPATLTPVGYLQFENGGLYARSSPEFSSRLGINQVTKLTLDERLQVLALSEPFTQSAGAAVSGDRPGEVFAGAQAALLLGEGRRPTIAVQYLRRLHASPAPELDLETFVQSATVLGSADLGGFHFDVNGLLMEQQSETSRVRQAQFAQTLSVSHPIKKVTVSGEVWHFSQPLSHGSAVGNLWCGAYPVRRNLVVDAGFDHGLTGSSTQWEGFAGFTYLLPHRLWRERVGAAGGRGR